jgi:hypothetical protein
LREGDARGNPYIIDENEGEVACQPETHCSLSQDQALLDCPYRLRATTTARKSRKDY